MKIEILPSLLEAPWDFKSLSAFGKEPFSSPLFAKLFEESGVVGPNSGWTPIYFAAIQDGELAGLLPSYIKTNSFGEFIFDWAWADLYQRHGQNYYPKLVAAVPFSPVNVPTVFGKTPKVKTKLLEAFSSFLDENPALSSGHALFTSKMESAALENKGFFQRKTIQYHLELDYQNFNDFLGALKSRKRKQIRKERAHAQSLGFEIGIKEEGFDRAFMNEIYSLYLETIDKKWSQAYLNKSFFELLGKNWEDSLIIAYAKDDRGLAAMSLFLKSGEALYGRYWGHRSDVHVPFLHFELCYYQGIEYCLQHGIKLFEAGAQGEQKLLRGFSPVEILSCHKLCSRPFHEAIERHVKMENAYTENQIKDLRKHLPYKTQTDQEEP